MLGIVGGIFSIVLMTPAMRQLLFTYETKEKQIERTQHGIKADSLPHCRTFSTTPHSFSKGFKIMFAMKICFHQALLDLPFLHIEAKHYVKIFLINGIGGI